VLATQCLLQMPAKTMEVRVEGELPERCTARTSSSRSSARSHCRRHRSCHRVYRLGDPLAVDGRAHDTVQHVDRSGARAGMVAPARPPLPTCMADRSRRKGRCASGRWWRGKRCAAILGPGSIKLLNSKPQTSSPGNLGTNPGMVTDITGRVPNPQDMPTPQAREATERALAYMD